MLNYKSLQNNERVFLAVTSVTVFEFEVLLMAFGEAFAETADRTVTGAGRFRKKGGGQRGKLTCLADKLLFILSYTKNYPLQTSHGLHFGLSQPNTCRRIHALLPKLKRALEILGCKPERTAEGLTERLKNQVKHGELVQDGVERMRERPQNDEQQKLFYSGKKNAYGKEFDHRRG
jgi:Helix-turn-helix of DDE superfamily endonuclease